MVLACLAGCGEPNSNKAQELSKDVDKSTDSVVSDDPELLGLTQTQCTASLVNTVTVSPRGQLYIDAPAVLNDNRTKNHSSTAATGTSNDEAGVWSFAFAMREIMETFRPTATVPLTSAQIDVEDLAVKSFIDRFGPVTVNSQPLVDRSTTRSTLLSAWGKKTTATGQKLLWWGGAPFKLVAIVNRMDIVKFTGTGSVDPTTAGEGRLVFGFTGKSRMTVILEYNLPVGTSSPSSRTQAGWTNQWHSLKNNLVDTDAVRTGIQPDQSLGSPNQTFTVAYSNQPTYLNTLQAVTNGFVLRGSQVRSRTTSISGAVVVVNQAAISQIRTNEFIQSPWELREIGRGRDSLGKAVLQSLTVKNNVFTGSSSMAVRSDVNLGAWIDANVICTSTGVSSCKFNFPNRMLPATITSNGSTFRIGGNSLEDFNQWFPAPADLSNLKRRFFALESCDGCHQSETRIGFTHTDPRNGAPSGFIVGTTQLPNGSELPPDLTRRLNNFRNLVCLASATETLSLSAGESVAPLSRRTDFSTSVH